MSEPVEQSCEPLFHYFDDGFVDESHPMAWVGQHCVFCGTIVHAGNNETMTAWFETGIGAVCFNCFAERCKTNDKVLDQQFETLGIKETR